VYFQQAAALDPNYAQAYAGIADSYALLGHLTVLPPATSFPQAKDAVAKALKIDPDLAEAHATLGFINMFYNLDGKAAEDEFRLALKNDPNYAIAHIWYAVDLAAMGRDNEATAQATQALVADPLSLTINTDIGLVAYLAGRNHDAIKAIKKALEIDPNFARGHFRLGNAYLKQGLNQQALAEYQKAVRIARAGDAYFDQNYEGAVGQAYALLGDKKEAENVLQQLSNRSKTHYVPAYSIALIYAGLGEKDLAFEWLQRAYEDHSTSMAYLKVDPALSGIRSDPRFASILHLVHF
jgi:tetratricopeptide (TPR) repeat protein